MPECRICPRGCRADRTAGGTGYCGETSALRVARIALHPWEEPPISGKSGSGTVFFSGCNLGCVFCQNYRVSHEGLGREITEDKLAEEMLRLRDEGAANINLVTPTHFTEQIIRILEKVRPTLGIPVVWNSGGYELPETLERLAGLVDIFLPDFKYASGVLAKQYSDAPDYPEVAAAALRTMYRLVGDAQFGSDGMMKKGIIVRHLVLPGGRRDSQEVLHCIAETVPVSGIRLSLMSQYTPEFAMQCPYPELHRRVTTFEYESVVKEAERLGFDGYFQRRSSADACYTPPFEGTVRVTRKTDRGNPVQKI